MKVKTSRCFVKSITRLSWPNGTRKQLQQVFYRKFISTKIKSGELKAMTKVSEKKFMRAIWRPTKKAFMIILRKIMMRPAKKSSLANIFPVGLQIQRLKLGERQL